MTYNLSNNKKTLQNSKAKTAQDERKSIPTTEETLSGKCRKINKTQGSAGCNPCASVGIFKKGN